MAVTDDINELLRLLKPDTNFIRLKQGVIHAVDIDTCSVSIGGGVVPGVRPLLDGYVPVVGDCVRLIKNGADMFVIGRTVGEARGLAMFYEPTNTPLPHATRHTHDLAELDEDPTILLVGDRIVPARPGRYRVTVTGIWTGNSAGFRGLYLLVNGTEERPVRSAPAGPNIESAVLTGSRTVRFDGEGDYVQVQSTQTSGGDLPGRIQELTVEWIGR